MSKNGFFHERPDDEDIWVEKDMIETVGSDNVNWHVAYSWVEPETGELHGSVELPDGRSFTAKSITRGADRYWVIFQ